jgi:hypothetical protein
LTVEIGDRVSLPDGGKTITGTVLAKVGDGMMGTINIVVQTDNGIKYYCLDEASYLHAKRTTPFIYQKRRNSLIRHKLTGD